MPHGPLNDVSGSNVVFLPPRPNSNTRSRATGMFDRSGFGMSTAGTRLRSGAESGRLIAELEEPADARIVAIVRKAPPPATGRRFGPLPSSCSHRLTSQTFALVVYLEKSMTMSKRSAMPISSVSVRTTGRRQQVAVVADQEERRAVAQRQLEEARDAGVEDPEAVLAGLDLEVRLVDAGSRSSCRRGTRRSRRCRNRAGRRDPTPCRRASG